MILWVRNAVLGQKSKTFQHRGVTVKAHQHKTSVELDVIYKKDLKCTGSVTLKTSTRGIRALTQCDTIPTALSLAFTKENVAKRRTLAKKAKAKKTPKIQTAEVENKTLTETDESVSAQAEVNPSLWPPSNHIKNKPKRKKKLLLATLCSLSLSFCSWVLHSSVFGFEKNALLHTNQPVFVLHIIHL